MARGRCRPPARPPPAPTRAGAGHRCASPRQRRDPLRSRALRRCASPPYGTELRRRGVPARFPALRRCGPDLPLEHLGPAAAGFPAATRSPGPAPSPDRLDRRGRPRRACRTWRRAHPVAGAAARGLGAAQPGRRQLFPDRGDPHHRRDLHHGRDRGPPDRSVGILGRPGLHLSRRPERRADPAGGRRRSSASTASPRPSW